MRYLFRQRRRYRHDHPCRILISVAVFAPVLATHDPNQTLIGIEDVEKRAPPCIHLLGCPADQPQHLMGTDGNVRDLFSRVLYGARLSLMVGIVSVSFAILVGATIGAISGYASAGLTTCSCASWMCCSPSQPDPCHCHCHGAGSGFINTLIAIAIVSIPVYARIMRASVLSIKEQDYILADRALGVPNNGAFSLATFCPTR
jgi:peptide/nickel transport system permease protein